MCVCVCVPGVPLTAVPSIHNHPRLTVPGVLMQISFLQWCTYRQAFGRESSPNPLKKYARLEGICCGTFTPMPPAGVLEILARLVKKQIHKKRVASAHGTLFLAPVPFG